MSEKIGTSEKCTWSCVVSDAPHKYIFWEAWESSVIWPHPSFQLPLRPNWSTHCQPPSLVMKILLIWFCTCLKFPSTSLSHLQGLMHISPPPCRLPGPVWPTFFPISEILQTYLLHCFLGFNHRWNHKWKLLKKVIEATTTIIIMVFEVVCFVFSNRW